MGAAEDQGLPLRCPGVGAVVGPAHGLRLRARSASSFRSRSYSSSGLRKRSSKSSVVIDLRERARKDADALVTIDDLKRWEKAHGRLPRQCGVFLNSGWDAKAGDARAFLGQDDSKTLHFPGFSKEACEFLLNEREVAGLAVDTLSLDVGASTDFAVHKLWLGAGKWGLECVANLSKLPPAGATVFVGAPKVSGASGGPTRVLAVWG